MSQKNVAIIGAGIIGTACAYELRRDGHEVTLYDRSEPGAEASFGNSGVLSPSAVVPISMPGLARRIPKWLLDPNGPLYLDWKHLPRLGPWLVRFERAGRADRVPAISAALSSLNRETVDLLRTMLRDARLEHLIEKKGVLNVFRSAREFDEERFATELRRRAH
jgi:D-amino-acid dehydrogenase